MPAQVTQGAPDEAPRPWLNMISPFVLLANILYYLVTHNMEMYAIKVIDILLKLGLHTIAAHTAAAFIHQHMGDETAGTLVWTALELGQTDLVQTLMLAMIKAGKTDEVSRMTMCLWSKGLMENKSPEDLADIIAPVCINAIDQGYAVPMGQVVVQLDKHGRGHITMLIILNMVEKRQRVDAAARLSCITVLEVRKDGPNAIAETAAQMIQHEHQNVAAKLIKAVYSELEGSKERLKVGCVVASAASRVSDRGHLAAAVATMNELYDLRCINSLADSMECLIKYLKRVDTAALLTWQGIALGRHDVIEATLLQMLLSSRVEEVSGLLEAAYSLNGDRNKETVCDVAAVAMIAAADKGKVGTLVEVNKDLYSKDRLDVLRDTVLALDAARGRRPDVSAKIFWRALQSGASQLVIDTFTALIRNDAIKPTANLITQLNTLASAVQSAKSEPKAPSSSSTRLSEMDSGRVLDAVSRACMQVIEQGGHKGKSQVSHVTRELLRREDQDAFVAGLVGRMDSQGHAGALAEVSLAGAAAGNAAVVKKTTRDAKHGKERGTKRSLFKRMKGALSHLSVED